MFFLMRIVVLRNSKNYFDFLTWLLETFGIKLSNENSIILYVERENFNFNKTLSNQNNESTNVNQFNEKFS